MEIFLLVTLTFTSLLLPRYLIKRVKDKHEEEVPATSLSKRYYYKNNNAYYTVLTDYGDELCLLREDVNTRILMRRTDFEKFLKEVE